MKFDEYEHYLINRLRGTVFDEQRADDDGDKHKLTYLHGVFDARVNALVSYDPDKAGKFAKIVYRFLHDAVDVSMDRLELYGGKHNDN